MKYLDQFNSWAKKLKRDVLTMWFVLKSPQTPWHVKAIAILVVSYALSPVDLIPDFIPVLGILDDVILVPIGVWIALRFTPKSIATECRTLADQWIFEKKAKPKSTFGLLLILSLWALFAWWFFYH